MTSKTVIELPYEEYQELRDTNRKILQALKEIRLITPDEFISRKEFMEKCRIGHSKFTELVSKGKLRVKIVGRKTYVLSTEVDRFFNGELN